MSAGGVGPEEIRNEVLEPYKERAASGLVERRSLGPSPRWLVLSVYEFRKIFRLSKIAIIAAIAERLAVP